MEFILFAHVVVFIVYIDFGTLFAHYSYCFGSLPKSSETSSVSSV